MSYGSGFLGQGYAPSSPSYGAVPGYSAAPGYGAAPGYCGAGARVTITIPMGGPMCGGGAPYGSPMMAPAPMCTSISVAHGATVVVESGVTPTHSWHTVQQAPPSTTVGDWMVPQRSLPAIGHGARAAEVAAPTRYEQPKAKSSRNSAFQVKEYRAWRDVPEETDLLLKRAYLAGFPYASYTEAGCEYEADLTELVRRCLSTGTECELKVPFGWSAPSVKKQQSAKAYLGKTPSAMTAKLSLRDALQKLEVEEEGKQTQAEAKQRPSKKAGSSTGTKVALGLAGGAALGAAAFAGGVAAVGEVSGDGAGEAFEDLGRAAGEVAEEAGGEIAEVAEDGWQAAVDELGQEEWVGEIGEPSGKAPMPSAPSCPTFLNAAGAEGVGALARAGGKCDGAAAGGCEAARKQLRRGTLIPATVARQSSTDVADE
eukprot:CAMPEP_0176128426 /NCGR_PEP_ID=MMETSP0120_2-20121206/64894_1 /TAXON_ID=160619 /ORGANISM="Kryptoperidinium foliaceum, Strain CCMP 1326" /LENGTH=426 /DNA_ID=CAMNT_0017463521 /DNA_START=46 /DNA_END=1327 /DNA_ORIENTATION=+